MSTQDIREDWEVFARDGEPGIGAIRRVHADRLDAYIEAFGEITLTATNIASAHDGKVVLNLDSLPERVRDAISHAHDGESRGGAL